jgi:hypothetical protein
MPSGHKHLITCRCILKQFEKLEDPPLHQFMVFSIVDDDDSVIPKYAQCNNCGIIHKVIDLCRSEIIKKEGSESILTIDDIKISFDERLVSTLERYGCDLPTWEAVQFIIDNERWGENVTISREEVDNGINIKNIRIMGNKIFKIENHVIDIEFVGKNV